MAESNSTESPEQNPYESSIDTYSPVLIPGTLSVPLAIGLAATITFACMVNWGIGISLIVLTIPAYIRAAGISFQKIADGEKLSTTSRIVAFVSSVLVVYVCAIAGGIGCFATCIGVLTIANAADTALSRFVGSDALVVVAVLLCGIGFSASAGVVYWLFWPKRKRKRK